ncbi:hypothetical protein HQ48_01750 [Porphyromonas sp. COT-290 OH3588]|nr:hypothetical protein HQ48_01750 [Porphyromonas sp. COT-290 OH3588]
MLQASAQEYIATDLLHEAYIPAHYPREAIYLELMAENRSHSQPERGSDEQLGQRALWGISASHYQSTGGGLLVVYTIFLRSE